MSTRMYCFRTPKSAFFLDGFKKIQEDYLVNYPYAKLWLDVVNVALHQVAIGKLLEAVKDFEKHSIEMQVFDEGETFLLRILTYRYDYWHLNRYESWGVEPVFYDDGSDVPPEQENNKAVADWLDTQITSYRYFMVPLLPKSFFMDKILDKQFELMYKPAEEETDDDAAF